MTKPTPNRSYRTGVTGVALAYAGVTWLVLEVMVTLADLGWLTTTLVNGALVLMLIGFPLVVGTAYIQQRQREGRPAVGALSSLLTWRNSIAGGVLALALWGLVAGVWIVNSRGAALGSGDPDAGDPVRVLAVLPFHNLLPDAAEQEWLVAGLHEQVIHEIQRLQLPGLRVISRTSTLPYAESDLSVPEIAARLGADAVLEGSVRLDGDLLRATMQLIDGATDHHEWSHEYDASLEESFLDAQRSVASRVARAFTETATLATPGDQPTDNPAALQAYLRGRYLWKNTGGPAGERASELFREAVALDPDFALAWTSIAENWLASAHFGVPPSTAFPRADSAAIQAMIRDPELADARIVLADARFHYDWNWEDAEREFRTGIRLNPSHSTGHWWYAGFLAARGRFDEAARQIERAKMLDPMAPIVDAFGARVLYWGGRYDRAEELVHDALQLAPNNFYALGTLGFIHYARGEIDLAIDAFRRSTDLHPKFRPAHAMALARAGRTDEARAITGLLEAEAAEGYIAPYERAFAYVGLGDHETALDLVEAAAMSRDAELIWIAVEPALDPIRNEPRFRTVLEKMGLENVHPASR